MATRRLTASRKAGGMVMFNEKADAKGLMKAVYNNLLDMWRNKSTEFPFPYLSLIHI